MSDTLNNFKPLPSVEVLRATFIYDEETGDLRYIRKPTGRPNKKRPGLAGCVGSDGYIYVSVGSESFLAHRVIWKMLNERDPPEQIDHKNRERANNQKHNLREAEGFENQGNRPRRQRTASRLKGVYRHKYYAAKWVANIVIRRKTRYLGIFDTEEAAHEAYMTAAREYFGAFASAGIEA